MCAFEYAGPDCERYSCDGGVYISQTNQVLMAMGEFKLEDYL